MLTEIIGVTAPCGGGPANSDQGRPPIGPHPKWAGLCPKGPPAPPAPPNPGGCHGGNGERGPPGVRPGPGQGRRAGTVAWLGAAAGTKFAAGATAGFGDAAGDGVGVGAGDARGDEGTGSGAAPGAPAVVATERSTAQVTRPQ